MLAEYFNAISQFTEGYLAMQKTLVGVIEVDPKRLLESGIRKELSKRLSLAVEDMFQLSTKKRTYQQIRNDFGAVIDRVAGYLTGIRRSFESVQDFLQIRGLEVWDEEWRSICDRRTVDLLLDSQLAFDVFRETTFQANFMAKLAQQLLLFSDPFAFVYVPKTMCWYEQRSKSEFLSRHLLGTLNESMGPSVLQNVDSLFDQLIVTELSKIDASLQKELSSADTGNSLRDFLFLLSAKLQPFDTIPREYARVYSLISSVFGAVLARLGVDLTQSLAHIGQLQLLRKAVRFELGSKFSLDLPAVSKALNNVNRSLVSDTCRHWKAETVKIGALSDLTADLGETIYDLVTGNGVGSSKLSNINTQATLSDEVLDFAKLQPFFVFALLYTKAPLFNFQPSAETLVSVRPLSRQESLPDSSAFLVGLLTLVAQLFSKNTLTVSVQLVDQYLRAQLSVCALGELPREFAAMVDMLNLLIDLDLSRLDLVDDRILQTISQRISHYRSKP